VAAAGTPARRGAKRTRAGSQAPQRTRARQGGKSSGERATIQIVPQSLASFNESKNILLHGNSGVGKTALAGGAPNSYFLTTEKGVVSAQRTGSQAQRLPGHNWDHVEASLDWADENLTRDNWLIVDSVSKMQTLLIRWILQREHDERDASLDVPQIQNHQEWQNMYMRFWDRMIDADYNTILVATSMHREDPDGESLVLPAITGKDYTISNYCCAQADCVFYYAVGKSRSKKDEETTRYILTETKPPYFAKNRYAGTLPRYVPVAQGEYDAMAWVIEQLDSEAA
jgi:hypothetical protein